MRPSRQELVMRQTTVALLGALALASAAGSRASAASTDPADIRHAAEQYIRELAGNRGTVFATAGHLDARLQLPVCAGELTPFLSPGAVVRARTTVGVRCAGPAWTVWLPVAVDAEASVLVARRPLRRGDVPAAADFEPARRRVPGLASAFVTDAGVLGAQRLRRPIAAGEALEGDMLESPPLVRRGQRVTAVSRSAGIEVRVAADAMANAAAGDRLRMRNPLTGRMLEGTVQPDGTVTIPP
jgi:flagella basal body P-ring formation protein FlgA